MMVNAMFDGMNLVAKEGPLVNERHGVSILSENTGAHEELGEFALSVNPFDVQELADAIHSALVMSPEARERRARGPEGDRHVARSGRLDRRADRGHPRQERGRVAARGERSTPRTPNYRAPAAALRRHGSRTRGTRAASRHAGRRRSSGRRRGAARRGGALAPLAGPGVPARRRCSSPPGRCACRRAVASLARLRADAGPRVAALSIAARRRALRARRRCGRSRGRRRSPAGAGSSDDQRAGRVRRQARRGRS